MNILFTIFIMWVLFCNGLCPMGLALGYTITVSVCVLVSSTAKSIAKVKAKKE